MASDAASRPKKGGFDFLESKWAKIFFSIVALQAIIGVTFEAWVTFCSLADVVAEN